MMCGKTLREKVANNVLREWTDFEAIAEHLRRHRLIWLGHLERMNVESLTRRVREMIIVGNMRRGRP